MVKVFTVTKSNKIKFTKEELEKILNIVRWTPPSYLPTITITPNCDVNDKTAPIICGTKGKIS